MRVLITGFTGFVGSHLADYLVARGDVEIVGTHRWRSRMENVDHLGDRVRRVECDLRDAGAVRRVLREVRPDRIFHLAAQSYVPTSWLAPGETLNGNVAGQVNLFEAIRDLELPARVHIAGSSEEYGLVLPHEVPLREDSPLRPLSHYAVSKVTQDLLAYQYWRHSPRGPDARVQPHGTAARRGLRHLELLPAGRRDREGHPRARRPGGEPRVGPGLHGRA
jgi:GDP-4-dehydro-6-deoxy-D-mannose reductase